MTTATLPFLMTTPSGDPTPHFAQWWHCLFDASEDAQLVCNAETVIFQANRRASQLLGLDDQRGGQFSFQQCVTPPTAAKLSALLHRDNGGQTTLQSITLLSSGRMSLVADLQVTPLGDHFSLVTIKDASRRWRMESHVQRLMAAVDATQDVVFMTDTENRITFANPAFQVVTGYTIEDALGHTVDFLRAPSEGDKIRQYQGCIAKGHDWMGELTNVHSDGSSYPVAASISPIFDRNGALLGYASFEREITQQKRLQEELRQERNYARSIIDSQDSAIYSIDCQFKLCHLNEGWKKMPSQHGWLNFETPPEAGRSLLDYVSSSEKRIELKRLFELVLTDGKPQETRATSPGDHQWLVKIAPWRQDGEIRGLIYVVTDQTQFHDLQKQLFQAQKMETIGALAAGVAHDFNNLLQAIRGNTTLLLLKDEISEPVRQTLQQIDQASESAAEITRQLLSFSRASDDKESVLDLNQVINESTHLFQLSLSSMVEVQLQLSPTPVHVQLDSTRAQQVLLNLLVNAQDAMPDGGFITIANERVTLTDAQAKKALQSPGAQFILCSVSDTGTGIPEDVMPHIFDPFYTTKEKGKGTGLGLAIVQSVIRQAGGFVEVDGGAGQGATFRLYLPIAARESIPTTTTRKGQFRRGTGRVLVVDDLELVLDFTRHFLSSAGYDVMVAHNPDEAITVLESSDKPVDLIFTDYNMGDRNGLELIEEAGLRWPGTKFILASGFLQDEEREMIESQYGTRILDKPFNVKEAADLIAEMLQPA